MSRRNHGDEEEEEEEFSAGEEDDAFDEDMEAIRRACRLVGVNPEEYINPMLSLPVVGCNSDDVDDLELVRNIRERFLIPAAEQPLITLPPVSTDEEEDDFEIFRRIQQRFAAYESDALSEKPYRSCDFDGPLKMDFDNTAAFSERSSMLSFEKGSMPKAALAFIDAINKNRSMQRFIRSRMIHLQARVEENNKLRQRLKKDLLDYPCRSSRKTSCALPQMMDSRVQLISTRKSGLKESKNPMDYGPVENPHIACYMEALKTSSVHQKRWSDSERENLRKGIRKQFQEMLLQTETCGLQEFSADSHDVDTIYGSVKDFEITPEEIRKFMPKVNWDQLASVQLPGRSGKECEARWLNVDDPLINWNPWTTSEDKKLLFIIQQKGLSNWIDIADSLGTNRTPFQCLSRFQRSLNASILKSEWTKDEDNRLRSAVANFGVGNWQAVASTLERRTGPQCSNRWKKSLDPATTKRGRFTPDEDNRLKIAVLLFGPKNWNKKAEFLPGRNQVQCRERWVNCLDPSLRRCEWTEEEDLRLEIAIQEHGYSWAKVATCVPLRTDNDCRRRWKKLFPNEVPSLQEARKIQKAALISNFVDRESERPALGPTDFLPIPNTDLLRNTDDPEPAPKRNVKTRRMPVSRKEKSAIGDASKKIKSNNRRIQADETAHVGITNNTSSVQEGVKSIKPQRKRKGHAAYTAERKDPVLHSNSEGCCGELNTPSLMAQLNGEESEGTGIDVTKTVDENGLEVCENNVCFSEHEENQNSITSGMLVLPETLSLPDTALLASTDKDDRICKPLGRRKKNSKTSNKSLNSLVPRQQVELERSGKSELLQHNQSKKRKGIGTDTSPLGKSKTVEDAADDCTLLGFLQKRLKRKTTTDDKKDDNNNDNDHNPTIASLLKDTLKRKE